MSILSYKLVTSVAFALSVGACSVAEETNNVETSSDAIATGAIDAWLVEGAAGITFTRAPGPTPNPVGAGCTSVFAKNVKLFVPEGQLGSSALTIKTEFSARFGSGTLSEVSIPPSAFTEKLTRASGERLLATSRPDFEIERSCQGTSYNIYQTSSVGGKSNTTTLAHVLSLPASKLLRSDPCTAESGPSTTSGVSIKRCSGALHDEVQLYIRDERDSGDGGVKAMKMARKYSAWVSVNGVGKLYPMGCNATKRGGWQCALNVTSMPKAFAYDDQGYQVDAGLFKWSRRNAETLNAWDVAFAIVDENGNWVNNDGQNFTSRLAERRIAGGT
jgi:hypothetical protein